MKQIFNGYSILPFRQQLDMVAQHVRCMAVDLILNKTIIEFTIPILSRSTKLLLYVLTLGTGTGYGLSTGTFTGTGTFLSTS